MVWAGIELGVLQYDARYSSYRGCGRFLLIFTCARSGGLHILDLLEGTVVAIFGVFLSVR